MLDQHILASAGRFVRVTWVKKDGSERTMVGRLGVTKYLKGGVSTHDPETFITLYSPADQGYRAINRSTIKSITTMGVTHVSDSM